MWYVIKDDELYHHGILGQKWGVRRFQNPDGTLTVAGKKRYNQYSDGSIAKKSGRTKRLEKAISSSGGTQTHKAVQEAKLAESREKDRTSGNGKKIAVAVGATVAAAVGVGLAVKYRKEIGAVASKLRNEKLPDLAAKGKNIGDNLSERAGKKASSELTKVGMLGRQFASEQKSKVVEAINKGIKEGSDELTKAGILAVAGIGAKKLSAVKEQYENSGSKNAVTEMLLSSGSKGVDSFMSSIKNSSSNSNNSNSGKANGKAGATVGKDLANKLGPARQEQYSPSDQKRYDRLFQDNNKVKGNDEVRLTVKALKRAGYSIDQIETYINGV